MADTLQALRGFREFYPEDCARRNHLFRRWQHTARGFGFVAYDIPTLEPLELFTEKSGPEIIEQLFNFVDKGGRAVALRPELTPSLARMVGSRAGSLKRPVKWFNIAENFRYERQQKGRLRSHYQFNADIFGEDGPGADAEIIALLASSLRSVGLAPGDFVIRLSDRELWMTFLAALGHEGEAAHGILGLIDKLERMPREVVIEKLQPWFGDAAAAFLGQVETLVSLRQLADWQRFLPALAPTAELRQRMEQRLAVWDALLADLEALGVRDCVRLDLGIVRGLAYYTGFVFEAFALDASGQLSGRALAGGGRYDHLIAKLGYPALPAVGFGMGDVTIDLLLQERNLYPALAIQPDITVVAAGTAARACALGRVTALRAAGWQVVYPLRDQPFAKQFKAAGDSGARWVFIFEEQTLAAGSVRVRNLSTATETTVPLAHLAVPGAEELWP
jgi:histidyl-tRNA synthetase